MTHFLSTFQESYVVCTRESQFFESPGEKVSIGSKNLDFEKLGVTITAFKGGKRNKFGRFK